jgi:hypothetical protein
MTWDQLLFFIPQRIIDNAWSIEVTLSKYGRSTNVRIVFTQVRQVEDAETFFVHKMERMLQVFRPSDGEGSIGEIDLLCKEGTGARNTFTLSMNPSECAVVSEVDGLIEYESAQEYVQKLFNRWPMPDHELLKRILHLIEEGWGKEDNR